MNQIPHNSSDELSLEDDRLFQEIYTEPKQTGSKQNNGYVSPVQQSIHQFFNIVDRFSNRLLRMNSEHLAKEVSRPKSEGPKLLNPDHDIKDLLTTARSLDDIWQFFIKRLARGEDLRFASLSILDESGDFILLNNVYPESAKSEYPIDDMRISMADTGNHLVQAFKSKDTTFCPHIHQLGNHLANLVTRPPSAMEDDLYDDSPSHIFSVPFVASNKTIALLTIGLTEMDAFAQAKLSYVYTLRDQIAQLIWNLVLQDRMSHQAQVDNLTGLMGYSYFQKVLETELHKAQQNFTSVTVMLLDINNLQEINDTEGHDAGDEAIKYLASTVRRLIRGLDTVARYGGDDVVVVLPETDSKQAEIIADRFIRGFRTNLPEELKEASISVGFATYPDDTRKTENIIKLAQQALHLARFKGEKTGESIRIASNEVDQLNDTAVLEVFASHVAKKYNELDVPSVYQSLLKIQEKKTPTDPNNTDELMLETITSLAGALDAKDRYTRGHSQAVANYAVALAHALQMNAEEVENTRLAAFLHDIGKIGIPEHILCKQGPLDDEEWEIMKKHPVIGAEQILAPVTKLHPIIPAVLHHHENWDGTGHPKGLKGDEIPIGARIISIVDAFHALTSDRAYRKALPLSKAKEILKDGAGGKWDPNLIEVFLKVLTIASPQSKTIIKKSPLSSGGTPDSLKKQAPVAVQLKLTDE